MSDESVYNLFAGAYRMMAHRVHANAVEHGFWPEGRERNIPEMLCLIHSEISEGLEGFRKGDQSDHIEGYSALEEELADTIIRIMDMGAGLNLRIPEALADKVKFNSTRPHLHGKNF